MSRGFTLAELLVVVAILTVLMGLIFAAGGAVLRSARRMACTSNLRQVGIATLAYASDNNERLPAEQAYGATNPDRSPAWYHRLPPYTDLESVRVGRTIFQCPSYTGDTPKVFANGTPKSYKMNSYLDNQGRPRHYRLGRAKGESRIVLFVDAVASDTGMGQWGQCFYSGVDDSRHAGSVCSLCLDGSTLLKTATPEGGAWAKALTWLPTNWQP